MGASENFCLRWNDFESNVSGAFRDLRNESDFFDVTLACDDDSGRTLQAHKVILSACSSFFKRMLRRMASTAPGHPNPLIYLRGVRLVDLESVLDFMYHGEVNVAQDDLNTFLGVAEDLQIKGLTQQSKEMGGRKGRKANSGANSGSAKRPRKDFADEDKSEVVNVKSEPSGLDGGPSTSRGGSTITPQSFEDNSGAGDSAEYGDDTYDDGFGYEDGEGGDLDASMDGQDSTKEFNALIDEYAYKTDKNWYCNFCGKSFGIRKEVGKHIATKHVQQPRIPCEFCGKLFRTKHNLRRHKCKYASFLKKDTTK